MLCNVYVIMCIIDYELFFFKKSMLGYLFVFVVILDVDFG